MATATHTLSKWSFGAPSEVRTFDKQRLELLEVGDTHVGRSTTEPGWRWSTSVGSKTGQKYCPVTHTFYIVSGQTHVVMEDGSEMDFKAGDIGFVPPGHDAWAVGDEPTVMVDFGGDIHAFGRS